MLAFSWTVRRKRGDIKNWEVKYLQRIDKKLRNFAKKLWAWLSNQLYTFEVVARRWRCWKKML